MLCLSNKAFGFAVVCFSLVPRLKDYTSRTVLAPIVSVTKLQIYRAPGREMAKIKLHSRSKTPHRVGSDTHRKRWAASLHQAFTHQHRNEALISGPPEGSVHGWFSH